MVENVIASVYVCNMGQLLALNADFFPGGGCEIGQSMASLY